MAPPTADKFVHLVVQRYRSCRILLNEEQWVEVGNEGLQTDASGRHCGLLVYVSFAEGATDKTVEQAAQVLLNLPVLTIGRWGDGSGTTSVLEMAALGENLASLVLVPQANLISKVKAAGKSIQYHGQIEKVEGERLFFVLAESLQAVVLDRQHQARNTNPPDWFVKWQKLKQPTPFYESNDVTMPPSQMFGDASLHSTWDGDGFPLTDAFGEPLTKSATKKLRKQYESQKKRHEKWLEKHPGGQGVLPNASSRNGGAVSLTDNYWADAIDPAFCRIVCGSFGKRQGLEVISDMGPFCHVFQV